MNGDQKDNDKPEKNNKAAITGFVLGLILFLASLTGICGVVLVFTLENIVLFFLGGFLLALPTLLFSLLGLRQKKQKTFAWLGLSLGIFCALFLPYRHIAFLPPGSLPSVLEIYKYQRACPKSKFWLNYDKTKIVHVLSQNTYFRNFGDIHFKSKPGTYKDEDIIRYAESYGWKYQFSVPFTKEDFKISTDNNSIDDANDYENLIKLAFDELNRFCPFPFFIEDDLNVHVFDTGNIDGIASFVVITKDGSDIDIRYTSPIFPIDPSSSKLIFISYLKEMSEERKKD